ncbi:flavin reductase family protein [Nonomuraea sp. NPDC050556]|uniref:flavin reductase family protein n=1 Tax=Nonomuraea sp. NPDC050556 TaxID=3364369 RepID=UPI0037AD847A
MEQGAFAPKVVNGARLRALFRRHVAGVAVVTSLNMIGRPLGVTVSTFTPVSLDPPLVGFWLAQGATWAELREAPGFAVNVLGAGEAEAAARFAGRGDRFAGVDWRTGPYGWPHLPGALTWLDCVPQSTHEAGDHVLLVGRVLSASAGPSSEPLIHHAGALRALEAR